VPVKPYATSSNNISIHNNRSGTKACHINTLHSPFSALSNLLMKFCFLPLLVLLVLPTLGKVETKLLAGGFDQPVWASAPKGATDHLWVVEKGGKIVTLNKQTGKKTGFLDICKLIKIKMNEQGLLGLAFSSDYLQSGKFYIYYTNNVGDSEICRFTAHGPNMMQCDSATRELIMSIKQSARNHNGGWIGFGPDGYLYIATGDGGAGNDPKNHGQDLSSHLGKILRIDVSTTKGYNIPADNPFIETAGAKPEIYMYGLRNPWRCSWDQKTKDFYIADVGQNHWEEINFLASGEGSGANLGWRLREGILPTPKKNIGGSRPTKSVDPVYAYKHGNKSNEGISVTGGYVYRGPIKNLQGKYFFADYGNPRIWSIEVKNGKADNFKDWTKELKSTKGPINQISSFGEDHDGNLLIISLSGNIYQLIDR
jgi:glucose/arabinose dehydrogenase